MVFFQDGIHGLGDFFFAHRDKFIYPLLTEWEGDASGLKAAGGSGFDIIFPSVTNVPNYKADDGTMVRGPQELTIEVPLSRLPYFQRQP